MTSLIFFFNFCQLIITYHFFFILDYPYSLVFYLFFGIKMHIIPIFYQFFPIFPIFDYFDLVFGPILFFFYFFSIVNDLSCAFYCRIPPFSNLLCIFLVKIHIMPIFYHFLPIFLIFDPFDLIFSKPSRV